MASQPAAARTLHFGPFEVDLPAGELRKAGRLIKLQDQPFQVLALLLRHPGEVVTREELQQALWSADTFVEFDQGLNTAIKKIRLALGDSADDPRFIETIPRKGYRFIAPVEGVHASPPVSARHFRGLWVATPFLVVAAACAARWLLNTRPQADDASLVAVPLTSYPGDEWFPSFSPDGNQVAFQWRRGAQDNFGIYVKLVGASEPLRLTNGPTGSYCPAWSPDGRSIAFFRNVSDTRAGVFLISPIGGPPRKLTEIYLPYFGSCVAWHPSGKWLIVSDRNPPGETRSLFALSLETGEKRRLTSPPQKLRVDEDPAVSPDGEALVFARGPEGSSDLYLLELSEGLAPKGEPKRITFEQGGSAQAAWTPDGRAIAFCSGSPHSPNLYRLAFSGPGWRPGKPQRLVFAVDGVRKPAISRQGRLAYSTFAIRANIWRLELNGGRPSAKQPERLIASTHLDHTPEYSPDGKRIAFASNRSGSHEIWVSNGDGSGTMQLTSFGGSWYTASPSWSPDGRQIYFISNANAGGRPGAYVVNSDGGQPKRMEGDGPDSWSRDGKWIYFISKNQVWKRPAGGGNAIQITREGGSYAHESPDGKFLYYLKNGEEFTSLWKVPVEGGDETSVLESVCCLNFAVVDRGLYFIPEPHQEHSSVQFLSFATGKILTIAALTGVSAYGSSVSPDGRWLLYSQYEPQGSDLWMVENFH